MSGDGNETLTCALSLVASRDENIPGGAIEWKAVEELFQRTAGVISLTVNGREIRTTSEHPFYNAEKGWLPAGDLVTGDRLVGQYGEVVIVNKVESGGEYEAVYNLRVADWHTYFVGDEGWGFGVWAHNADYSKQGADGERLARKYLEKKGYTVLGTISNRSGNGIDIITRNRFGSLRFFEVKTSITGNVKLSSLQSKGARDYIWNQLRYEAGEFTHIQPRKWDVGNIRGGMNTRSFAQSIVEELNVFADRSGRLPQDGIRGVVFGITGWNGSKRSGKIIFSRWL